MSFYNLFLFYISLGWVSFHSGNKGKIQCLLSLTVSKYILCLFFFCIMLSRSGVQTTNSEGNVPCRRGPAHRIKFKVLEKTLSTHYLWGINPKDWNMRRNKQRSLLKDFGISPIFFLYRNFLFSNFRLLVYLRYFGFQLPCPRAQR